MIRVNILLYDVRQALDVNYYYTTKDMHRHLLSQNVEIQIRLQKDFDLIVGVALLTFKLLILLSS